MKVHCSAHPTTFGELGRGTCYFFDIGGKTHVGLKVREMMGRSEIYSALVIWPGRPDLHNRPGFLDETISSTQPVLALPDAIFEPILNPQCVQVGRSVNFDPGQMFLSDDKWIMVVAGHPGKNDFVDIEAGETVRGVTGRTLVHFSAWHLAIEGLDEHETICVWPPPQ